MQVPKILKRKHFLLVLLFIVIVVAGVLLYSDWLDSKSPTPPKSTNSQPLRAGGIIVPAAFQSRALRLGYYCPSWDSSPGQITSDICLPLDR